MRLSTTVREENDDEKLLRTVPVAVIANASQRSVAILFFICAQSGCQPSRVTIIIDCFVVPPRKDGA